MTDEFHGEPPQAADAVQQVSARVWNSAELLEGTQEVRIVHGGEIYRLRLTRNGKLILQK